MDLLFFTTVFIFCFGLILLFDIYYCQDELYYAIKEASVIVANRDPTPTASLCESGPHCCVCMVNLPNILFLPCLHQSVCGSCCKNLVDCPICRAPIKSSLVTVFT